MSKHKIPCIRCLLRDLDQKAALKQVTAYRERLPVQQRANKELLRKDFRFAVIASGFGLEYAKRADIM